ncbi:MAG: tetratricopeptide repeat protein [Planctomycetota bacterium]
MSEQQDRRIGEVLVRLGKLAPPQLEAALHHQQACRARGQPVRLGQVLVEWRLVAREDVLAAVAWQAGVGQAGAGQAGVGQAVAGQAGAGRAGDTRPADTRPSDPRARAPASSSTPPTPHLPAGLDPTDRAEIERALAAGERLGDYVLLGELGRGGMGVVRRAWEPRPDRFVAVKQMLKKPDAKGLALFQREARVAAKLEHPDIAPLIHFGEDAEGRPYLVMPFVQGSPLAALCPLPPRRAAAVLARVARAVAHAHAHDVVHRDLKPQNVLLRPEDAPCVLDFGLAKDVGSDSLDLTDTGQVRGTPLYMAPEQLQPERVPVGPLTDVYGLGATLYECLTGRPPVEGESGVEVMIAIVDRDPTPPRAFAPAVARDLETICLKCLEKDPDHRYPSAVALAEDLERYLAGEEVLARPVPWLVRALRRARRHPARVAAAALAALLALALGLGLWTRAEAQRELAAERAAAQEALGREQRKVEQEQGRVAEEQQRVAAMRDASALFQQIVQALNYRYQRLARDGAGRVDLAREAALIEGARGRTAPLLARLDALLAGHPRLLELRVLRGRVQLLLNEPERALVDADAALALDPAAREGQLLRGRALMRQATFEVADYTREREALERLEAAARALAAAGELEPLDRAWLAIARGQHAEAVAALRGLVEQPSERPEEPRLALVVALGFQLRGARGEAELLRGVREGSEQALAACPRVAQALFLRAYAACRLAPEDEAITRAALDDFGLAILLRPGFELAYVERGRLRTSSARRGRTLEAFGPEVEASLADYERAIALRACDPEPRFNRGVLRGYRGELEGALADLREAARLDPSVADYPFQEGHVHLRGGRKDEALAAFSRALTLAPDHVDALFARAALLKERGDAPGALRDFGRLLELAPDHPKAAAIRKAVARLERQAR